jgi:hypothetical protein
MNSIENKISYIIYNNLNSDDTVSIVLKEKIKKELILEFQSEQDKNLINLLELCKIVEKEKNGLLFIEKMIINLISKKIDNKYF